MPAFPYPFPQPTNNALTFGDGIANDVSVLIYTKRRWADAWTQETGLDLLSVTWNAAPNIPTATIRYRYGRAVMKGSATETTLAKKNLLGYYVKIVVVCSDGNRVWHGFVDDAADEQTGIVARTVPGTPPTIANEPTGIQTFSCVGMIAALDRAPIQRTYFRVTAAFSNNGTDTQRVAWVAPAYNVADDKAEPAKKFGGFKIPKTRTVDKIAAQGFGLTGQTRDVYQHQFAGLYGLGAAIDTEVWKLGDVLENLVAFNAPRVGMVSDRNPIRGSQTQFVPVWVFDHDVLNPPDTITQYADWILPRIDCDGLTLKAALDRLLSPTNGHGYWVWVDESVTPHRVYVEPFTTLTEAITRLDENSVLQTIPANTRLVNLSAATDSATAISIQANGAQYYTAVQVTGAPMVTVCTIDTTDQLEPAWPATLETEYNAEIAGLNPAIMRQLQRMRDIRELPKYRPIGRQWRVKFLYNWKDSTPASDVFDHDEQFAATPFYETGRYLPFPVGMRILPDLPFREGVNYAEANTTTLRTNHESARTPWRKAEVYAKTHAADATLTGPWICWSTKAVRDVLYDPNDPTYGLEATELTNQMAIGVVLDVTGGYQGALEAGGGRVAPHVPKIDPAELKITVAIQSDERVGKILYNPLAWTPAAGQTPAAVNVDADRIRVIELGQRLQKIKVMKDTIVGTTDAGPVTVPAVFQLRDDGMLALQICSFASQYYFTPRQIVRVVSRRATAKLWPNQMLGVVNPNTPHAATCNAQISEVAITMGIGTNGSYTAPTFTVQTSFGELDPLQFFPQLQTG